MIRIEYWYCSEYETVLRMHLAATCSRMHVSAIYMKRFCGCILLQVSAKPFYIHYSSSTLFVLLVCATSLFACTRKSLLQHISVIACIDKTVICRALKRWFYPYSGMSTSIMVLKSAGILRCGAFYTEVKRVH